MLLFNWQGKLWICSFGYGKKLISLRSWSPTLHQFIWATKWSNRDPLARDGFFCTYLSDRYPHIPFWKNSKFEKKNILHSWIISTFSFLPFVCWGLCYLAAQMYECVDVTSFSLACALFHNLTNRSRGSLPTENKTMLKKIVKAWGALLKSVTIGTSASHFRRIIFVLFKEDICYFIFNFLKTCSCFWFIW